MSVQKTSVYKFIGKSLPRSDGLEKVTGQALYLNDIVLPGMLYGKILRSPIAHGKIVKIDTSRVKNLSEVKAVITAEDLPDARFGSYMQDATVLARGKVRYIGEPVAAVAAIDEDTALKAIELIDVEYEELEPVFDPEYAINPDAPIVHEDVKSYVKGYTTGQFGNVCTHITMREGDVEESFKKSDYVFEDTFTTPMQHQTQLEPCGAIASFDCSGNLTLWTPSQGVHMTQILMSQALKIPMNKIRVISPTVGGGFGGRVEIKAAQPVAAALAQKAKKPVKLVFSRKEDFISNGPRHAAKIIMKTGLSKDGRILARQARVVIDSGAYADHGPGVIDFALKFINGPYKIPAFDYEGYCVYTNNIFGGGYRGFGNPQSTFARESHMDMLAQRLGIDPIDFRMRNFMEDGDTFIGDRKVPRVTIKETLQRAAKEMNYGEKRKNGHGIGVSCFIYNTDAATSSALVIINNDGTILLSTSANEIGQGSATVLRQIAAEELGVPIEKIGLAHADTHQTTFSWSAGGSRMTRTSGIAILRAAADAKRQIIEVAAKMLDVKPDELVYESEKVLRKDDSDVFLTLEQIGPAANWEIGGPIIGKGAHIAPKFKVDEEKIKGLTIFNNNGFIFGTHIVEVEVDEEMGKIKVINAAAAHDVGQAINPILLEGQIEGGLMQGLGYSLTEDLVSKDGIILNPSFLDYKIPTAADIPNIKSIIIEEHDPDGPFGAKGVAETSMTATAAAIANAVYDAIGIRVKDLPLGMEKVWEAIRDK